MIKPDLDKKTEEVLNKAIEMGLELTEDNADEIKTELRHNLDIAYDKQARELPGSGSKLMSEFAKEIADILKPTNTIFYRPDLKKVVEISNIEINKSFKTDKDIYTGFAIVEPPRFVTLVEKFIIPFTSFRNPSTNKITNKIKSMSPTTAGILLCSDDLIKGINPINRIFNVPIPIMHDNVLSFPKKGYDERFCSWLPHNSPDIKTNMPLDYAKKLIEFIYSEFAFETTEDRDRAISALITPACRGLFPSFSTRTPAYVYRANRERAGKDYCAGITGIVYEGVPAEDSPISSSTNSDGDSNEFSKKILSAMISGRTRMHFSNNKGHIDNAAFEKILTSEIHTDRQLGVNKELTFANEIDFSLSGNIGITYTPDFANRCRFINLFLDIEDANARKFKIANLHDFVKRKRGDILSAIYTLIKNWIDTGMHPGTLPFSSFPAWARVVGGIMEAAGWSNPCLDDKASVSIGGDEETSNIKTLFEVVAEKHNGRFLNIDDIKTLIYDDERLRDLFQLENRSDSIKFGIQLKRFKGRILSNIRLSIDDTQVKPRFIFTKIVKIEVNKTL